MKKLILFITLSTLLLTAQADDTGKSCNVTDDCPDLQECVNDICTRKALFPITAREVIGTFIILILNAFLTAGGVGAAAAYIPYIMVLFNATLQQSVYIGYACVFGGGVGNIINIITLKNQTTKRFMTNYNVNMIVLPALMIGIMIGLILNRIFPPIVVNIVLLVVLIYSTAKNLKKYKANLEKEKKEKNERQRIQPAQGQEPQAEQNGAVANNDNKELNAIEDKKFSRGTEANENTQQPLNKEDMSMINNMTLGNDTSRINIEQIENSKVEEKAQEKTICTSEKISKKYSESAPENSRNETLADASVKDSNVCLQVVVESGSNTAAPVEEDPLAEKREELYKKEQKYPYHKLRELLYNIVIIILFGLIRGTKVFKPIVGLEWTCGWDFLWFALSIIAYSGLLARSIYLVLKWQKEKQAVGYEFLPEEPILDKSKIIRLVIVATIAGVIGAVVALGGSMIIGPTLLDFKIPPANSAATTSVFMIFSMFNAMFQTILNGKLTGSEIAWYLCLSFVFSFASSKIVNWYIKKTGKQSMVMLLIITVAVLGFICMLVLLIINLVTDYENQVKFHSVC